MCSRLLPVFLWLAVSVFAQERRITPLPGAGRRVALVIGNNAYPWKPLVNAVNDARSLAALLPKLGFEPGDITLLVDANLKQMQRAGREFADKLRPDDLAFVYYSGHGVEVRGENFLVPTDFPADASELEVRDEAYSAQQLLRGLEESNARTRILILDACRNNPLRATRAAGGGLARMDGQGTLVVFSTSAGKTADDNRLGRNGLFTAELLKALPKPGITLDQMLREVARAVYKQSGAKQTPAIYGLLLEDFPLVSARAGPVNPPARKVDAEAWELIRSSASAEDFDEFRKLFPQSEFAPLAALRLSQLRHTLVQPMRVAPVMAEGPAAGQTKVNPKDGLTYVWIPPGKFMMGCSEGDAECHGDEKPPRDATIAEVTIAEGFWMGRTAVTQAAYQRVIGGNPSFFRGAELPVETVKWDEARSYCESTGGRLPTEAEWEYAGRAGTKGARYGTLSDIAWYSENAGAQTHEVGQKTPNDYGLYDMLGNVWQWTADWYEEGKKSLRGGSRLDGPRNVRVSHRRYYVPDSRASDIGFRCVQE